MHNQFDYYCMAAWASGTCLLPLLFIRACVSCTRMSYCWGVESKPKRYGRHTVKHAAEQRCTIALIDLIDWRTLFSCARASCSDSAAVKRTALSQPRTRQLRRLLGRPLSCGRDSRVHHSSGVTTAVVRGVLVLWRLHFAGWSWLRGEHFAAAVGKAVGPSCVLARPGSVPRSVCVRHRRRDGVLPACRRGSDAGAGHHYGIGDAN